MAKAVFHKHQRVYVHPVGTWANIEHVKPQWVKDVEEPVKVFYDCGLGRDFSAHELAAEVVEERAAGHWRVMRAKNKWQGPEECQHHPQPGSYPIVVTDEQNWGGWRVPGAEYDRDPHRIEQQARLIAQSENLLTLAETLVSEASENSELGHSVTKLAEAASRIVKHVYANAEE